MMGNIIMMAISARKQFALFSVFMATVSQSYASDCISKLSDIWNECLESEKF